MEWNWLESRQIQGNQIGLEMNRTRSGWIEQNYTELSNAVSPLGSNDFNGFWENICPRLSKSQLQI